MKKLEKWKEIFKKHGHKFSELARYGFKPHNGRTYVWVNKKERVVIKSAAFYSELPAWAGFTVPTVHDGDYQIQPLCHTPDSKDLVARTYELVNEVHGYYPGADVHSGNVGYYRNRLVLFDW